MKPLLKILTGFAVLFACYHAAEYMVLYQNNATGFLLLSALFFILTFAISKWQGDKNVRGWGLQVNKHSLLCFATGLLVGLTINMLLFLTCLLLHIEVISFIPSLQAFIPQAALLIFGCAFSSLTEDILTRSYVYRHGQSKASPVLLILISAAVYTLNHIHRLNEPVYLLYIFIIGIQLMIPLLLTKNMGYTFGIHWAGNMVYHVTNNVMHTSAASNHFPAMWVAIFFILLLVPINYFIGKQLARPKTPTQSLPLYRHSSSILRHSSELI